MDHLAEAAKFLYPYHESVQPQGQHDGRANVCSKIWQTDTDQAVVDWQPAKLSSLTTDEPLDADTTFRMATLYVDAISNALRQFIA
jgi:hypothetical protein